ncbi:MAG TPA: sigma factor-like helix-turn-helix DNA-binding protein [Terriglobales bacterium]|jgi:DNA-directed RNA polymerase specialized sigma24 family protein
MKRISSHDRCTESDYRSLFASSRERLRWLCYSLTGDEPLSEKAVDAALEQTLKGAELIFREWMSSWARRLMIKFCIATVRPVATGVASRPCSCQEVELGWFDPAGRDALINLPADALQQKLLRLETLPRFVFVLRAIEGYSRRETALLLGIDDRTCEWAYASAARGLQAEEEQSWNPALADSTEYWVAQAGD